MREPCWLAPDVLLLLDCLLVLLSVQSSVLFDLKLKRVVNPSKALNMEVMSCMAF